MAHNHESFGQSVEGQTNGTVLVACPRGGPVSLAMRLSSQRLAGPRSYTSGDRTCLEVPDGIFGSGITCTATRTAAKAGLAGVLVPADSTGSETGTETLYAVAPNGAISGTVGGRTATVVDGLLQVTLPSNASALTWSPSGSTMAVPHP